jgi:hemolysin activation/secretion protein
MWLVDRFETAWRSGADDLPAISELNTAPFRIHRTASGYTATGGDGPGVRTDLRSLRRHGHVRIDTQAIEVIASAMERQLAQDGLLGATVQPSLQLIRGGTHAAHAVWFLAEVPLPDLQPNASLPYDLVPLREHRSATQSVDDVTLHWVGDAAGLPDPADLLQSVRAPVTIRGGVVMVSDGADLPLRRLMTGAPARWTPAALQAVVEAVGAAAHSAAPDATVTMSDQLQPSPSGGAELSMTAQVTVTRPQVTAAPAASEPVLAAPTLAGPKQVVPNKANVPQPGSSESGTAAADVTSGSVRAAAPIEQIDGVRIAWSPDHEAWGDPASLFSLTTVRLQVVDDAVQGGWADAGDQIPLADLQRFPTRGWRPSATRGVVHAMEVRLRELGMTNTRLATELVGEQDGTRMLVITLSPPPRPSGMPPLATTSEAVEGDVYYVAWPFEIMYSAPHRDLPPASSFEWIQVRLVADAHGWTAASGDDGRVVTLAKLNESGPMRYDASAVVAIGNAIGGHLVAQDLVGVGVQPLPSQIPSSGPDAGADLRGDRTELTLVVTVGRVAEVRTIASGERVDDEDRVNHPAHQRIADRSPLKAGENGEDGALLRRKELDDYLYFLSRHPGRDIEGSITNSLISRDAEPPIAGQGAPVDVELSTPDDGEPGDAYLTYRVAEAKPWTLWFQYGNTGTEMEGYQRFRLGFVNTQLTNNDDIFSIQYVTSSNADTNAVVGSYEAPLGLDGRLRWGINGSWSQYVADQFGIGGFANTFTGYSWAGGGDLRLNVYQDGPFFADLVGGLRLQHLSASNDLLGFDLQEQASFLVPYGMLQFDRGGQWSNFRGSIGMEGNVTSHSDQTLARLGFVTNRFDPANQFARLNWSATLSTYLEPLIDADAWADPTTPRSSTLAHELLVNFSGQYAFGSRLLPQFQSVSGGPGTNRGYPVSVAAGDNAINLSGEYRFHLPRTFDIEPQAGSLFGQPFRGAPQHVYGRPDWDLVLLGFVDYSWLTENGDTPGEFDETLLSAGVGMELVVKRNLQIRLDWGWALRALENGLYDSGHNRLYVQASLSF